MDSPKLSATFLLLTILLSTIPPSISCGSCHGHTPSKPHHPPKSRPNNPPKVGPIILPPIIGNPPVVGRPPINLPPIGGGGGGGSPPSSGPPCSSCGTTPKPSPPSTSTPTCPIDTLKLGACVDLLSGLVHIGLGDPVVNQCCPLIQGLVEIEAAVCLCTTIRLKLLNINIYLPLALQLLLTCGKAPPPGYTCTI